MIIKLEDSDITTAKENVDDEGIIHIPDAIWNHIIKEVEHPEQTFVNSLYIDVNGLENVVIPVIKNIKNNNIVRHRTAVVNIGSSYEWNIGDSLVIITENPDSYEVSFCIIVQYLIHKQFKKDLGLEIFHQFK